MRQQVRSVQWFRPEKVESELMVLWYDLLSSGNGTRSARDVSEESIGRLRSRTAPRYDSGQVPG